MIWGGGGGGVAVEPSLLLPRPTVPVPDNECGAIGGMIERGKLPQCRFIHHRSHMTWPGPPQLEARD
jgi:hypothetical protein